MGASLPKTSTSMKEISSRPFDKDTVGGVHDATHNPISERMREAHLNENELSVVPINMIKCFGKVNFEYGAFEFFGFNGVHNLLCSANGFMNLYVVQKWKLFLGNMRRENGFNTIRNYFGYNFIYSVIAGDRSEVKEGGWVIDFWDQSNECGNETIIDSTNCSSFFDDQKEIPANQIKEM